LGVVIKAFFFVIGQAFFSSKSHFVFVNYLHRFHMNVNAKLTSCITFSVVYDLSFLVLGEMKY